MSTVSPKDRDAEFRGTLEQDKNMVAVSRCRTYEIRTLLQHHEI